MLPGCLPSPVCSVLVRLRQSAVCLTHWGKKQRHTSTRKSGEIALVRFSADTISPFLLRILQHNPACPLSLTSPPLFPAAFYAKSGCVRCVTCTCSPGPAPVCPVRGQHRPYRADGRRTDHTLLSPTTGRRDSIQLLSPSSAAKAPPPPPSSSSALSPPPHSGKNARNKNAQRGGGGRRRERKETSFAGERRRNPPLRPPAPLSLFKGPSQTDTPSSCLPIFYPPTPHPRNGNFFF